MFDGESLIRASVSWLVVKLPDASVGLSIKKRVYPLEATSEYLLVDKSKGQKIHPLVPITNADEHFMIPVTDRRLPTLQFLQEHFADDQLRIVIAAIDGKGALKRKSSMPADQSTKFGAQAMALISSLGSKNFQQLRQIWLNAVRVLPDLQSQDQAAVRRLLNAIEREWQQRAGSANIDDEEYFAWPTTDAPSASRSAGIFTSPDSGVLSFFDYHVGRTSGQKSKLRKSILDRIFECTIPPIFDAAYLKQWGGPASSNRLQKMAESLAALTRNAKRRNDDRFEQAIGEWESDLMYLYERYYVGRFHFAWPSIKVGQ